MKAMVPRIADGWYPESVERTSWFIPRAGGFLSSDYPPASKRRIMAIILAKHRRKPLSCGQ
jgi:hypothetical protein